MGDAESVTETETDTDGTATPTSRLGSRILVTWIELTAVGITGGALGDIVGGPPGFIVYLLTTLLTVAILFYNVNELVEWRIRKADRG
jgi:hypothetical protein